MNCLILRNTLATCLLVSSAIPTLALADPGDMMHMTITGKVQVANPPMSMAVPTINRDVCTPKQIDVRTIVTENSHHKDCSYTNYKQDGNSVTFHYACAGDKQQLDGDGSFTLQPGGFNGTTHANANAHGMSTTVDLSYSSTRTGASCEYTPPKSAQ